jgi:glutaminyl-tRNA synthetase
MQNEKKSHNKSETAAPAPSNFLHQIIEKDLASGKYKLAVTRFPPEPNGYLHIGHSKAICVNFGLALEFQGRCHMRFDDTNPETEETEYVDSIMNDVRWLGFDWGKNLFYASDYFEQIYQVAEKLIKDGKAYVCSLNEEQTRQYRGDFTTPGKDSPYRNRSVEENLDLFRRMRAGEFEDGACTLRAKIDMKSPNMNMRDPLLYRIKKVKHHRTGDKWCIYPMYDFAHPLSDAIEEITHSICTLEFQDHRPFYDWTVEHSGLKGTPHQFEFARLNLTYTVMSKRRLLQLVKENHVSGWDDPRMPTISGIRRRGYRPEAMRAFAKKIGVAKAEGVIDVEILEQSIKEDLDQVAHRAMAVLDPVKMVIENYPADKREEIQAPVHPKKAELGNRTLTFTKEVFIDRKDFMENPPADYHRLKPGGRVRLRNAYVVTCKEVIKDAKGNITELRCEYDPVTLGGKPTSDGQKVKGIIHWVSAQTAIDAEVRVYGRLFTVANPNAAVEGRDWKENLNPESLKIIKAAKLEASLKDATPEHRYQFERVGYFCVDPKDSKPEQLVFNMTVEL